MTQGEGGKRTGVEKKGRQCMQKCREFFLQSNGSHIVHIHTACYGASRRESGINGKHLCNGKLI